MSDKNKLINLDISKEDYLVLKNFCVGCAQDCFNQTLTYIYYNAEHKEFIACDGHIFVVRHCSKFSSILQEQLENQTEDFLMHQNSFALPVKAILPINKINIDNYDQLPYPDVYKCIPEDSSEKFIKAIGINANLFTRLAKAFKIDNAIGSFKYKFYGRSSAIKIYLMDDTFAGIIMPITFDE